MDHVLSELFTVTHPSWVALNGKASFELHKPLCHDKAVIHEGYNTSRNSWKNIRRNKQAQSIPARSQGVCQECQAALHSGHFPRGLSVQQKHFEGWGHVSLWDYEQVCLLLTVKVGGSPLFLSYNITCDYAGTLRGLRSPLWDLENKRIWCKQTCPCCLLLCARCSLLLLTQNFCVFHLLFINRYNQILNPTIYCLQQETLNIKDLESLSKRMEKNAI